MPTYDYVCLACGHALEIEHSISAPARKKCPKCGKSRLERRIGAGAGFVFKGSGFYKTDYRTKPAEHGAAAAKSDSKTSEVSSAAASEPAKDAAPAAQTSAAKPSAAAPSSKAANSTSPSSASKSSRREKR